MEKQFSSRPPSSSDATGDTYTANPLLASPEADRFAAHCLLLVDAFLAEQAAAATQSGSESASE